MTFWSLTPKTFNRTTPDLSPTFVLMKYGNLCNCWPKFILNQQYANKDQQRRFPHLPVPDFQCSAKYAIPSNEIKQYDSELSCSIRCFARIWRASCYFPGGKRARNSQNVKNSFHPFRNSRKRFKRQIAVVCGLKSSRQARLSGSLLFA